MIRTAANKPSKKTGQLMGFPNRHERAKPRMKGKIPTLWKRGRESRNQSFQVVSIEGFVMNV
jgi:hypothetical protein